MKPLQFSRSAWAVLVLGTLGFTGFRLAQLLRYGDAALLEGHRWDWARAFWMGTRFDFKVLAVMVLALLVPASLVALPRITRKAGAWLQQVAVVALFFTANFAAASQHFYYGFYGTPFTPIVFGLYEDDTWAVLASIWSHFPVVLATAGVIVLSALQSGLVSRFTRAGEVAEPPSSTTLAYTLATVLALALLARGSLGTFPLNREDATVAPDPFVNNLVRNAPQTLYDAFMDRQDEITITENPAQRLPAYGFGTLDELARTLGVPGGAPRDLEAFVFRRTRHNPWLAAHPPHVVFALLESWGAHQLEFNSPQTDVAGAMTKHLRRDVLFRNFFPAQNGTHPTLEALLLNSPLTPLTQGQYGFMSFSDAAPRPFKEQGYRTAFLYGGSNAWRSLGRTLKHQYFDDVYDIGDIMARYPDAQRTVWGVYDEYLFRFAYDLLDRAEAEGQALFLFLVTTTNHPPHSVPSSYHPLPLDLAPMRPFLVGDVESSEKLVQTYQYATHQLGLFLDQIEASPLGHKTIVTATGDHNLRTLLQYRQPADAKDLHRVPGYFYVPAPYRPATPPDLHRYAGHRDIFPTLYNLALSDARYPAFGDNLFEPVPEKRQFAMVAYEILFSRAGALLPFVGKPAAFGWDDSQTRLEYIDPTPAILQQQGEQARAWTALADWYTRYQVIAWKKSAAGR
ncbi:MAG TPA: sulfatase-like hydrolase/transferase [Burkholderiales bacterium]